jgi:hypothetical protein
MLVLWDRDFDGNDFLAAVHTTGADASYLSDIGGVPVRIIEAQVSVTCADGSGFASTYRLVTTLLDAHRFPGDRLGRVGEQSAWPGRAVGTRSASPSAR